MNGIIISNINVTMATAAVDLGNLILLNYKKFKFEDVNEHGNYGGFIIGPGGALLHMWGQKTNVSTEVGTINNCYFIL